MSSEYIKNLIEFGTGDSSPTTFTRQQKQDDFYLDKNVKLKKDDIKNNYEYSNAVREYMIKRKGVDYQDTPTDEMIEDYVEKGQLRIK